MSNGRNRQIPYKEYPEIYKRHLAGETIYELAGNYCVTAQRISQICKLVKELKGGDQE